MFTRPINGGVTTDRWIHAGVAVALWVAVGWARKKAGRASAPAALPPGTPEGERALAEVRASWRAWAGLPAVLLGAWVPDWDLWVGGIGFHRSPLFHSVGPVLVAAGLLALFRLRGPLWGLALRAYAVGVASHLLWDIVQYGDVRWIRGGNADRLFLLANAGVLVAWAALAGGQREPPGEDAPA